MSEQSDENVIQPVRIRETMGIVLVFFAFVWDILYALVGGWIWMYFCGAFMALGLWFTLGAYILRANRKHAS